MCPTDTPTAAQRLVWLTKSVSRIDADILVAVRRLDALGREKADAVRAVELQAERVALADAGKALG